MKNKKNVPDIRFKGFTEEWVPISLCELSEPLEYGLNAPATAYDGINKYIRITDIDDNTHMLNFNGLTSPNANLSLSTNYQLMIGDILFARTGASVGKSYHYKETDGLVYYAGFLIRARIKSNINSEFVFQNTLTSRYDKFVKITSQRSGQPGINAQEYSSWELTIPKSADEQKALGKYFQNIDRLIFASQEKLDKLKSIKKACLEKMFPRGSSTTPELRFKGFTDEWREKSFAEVAEVKRGLTYTPTSIRNEGVRVLRSSNINEDTFVISKDDVFVAKDAVNITYAKDKDILITSANGSSRLVGKHTIISGIVNKSTVHGGFMLLATATEAYFVNASMSSSWYQKFINLYVAGGNGAIGNLNKSDLEKQLISVPINEEQKSVGRFFKKLDKLTALTEQKIEKLKNIKKACLDKMFVNTED